MAQLMIPLDAKRFATGMTWKDYVAQMGDTRARTEDNSAKAGLTDEERKFFNGVTGVKYCMMLAENWCGDVHRNSPLIAHICEEIPGCELRVFLRDANPDLRDTFLNNGYQSIPVVVFFDKDWNEIGRWIERSLSRRQGGDHPRQDASPPRHPGRPMGEFRKMVQAEYDAPGGPMWRPAVNEVKLLLETRLGLKK
jgi:hypothetical protein